MACLYRQSHKQLHVYVRGLVNLKSHRQSHIGNMVNLKSRRQPLMFSGTRFKLAIIVFALVVFASSFFVLMPPVLANNVNKYVSNQASSNQTSMDNNYGVSEKELAAAELKLLGKNYANDPLSKRLQRLELLTFGGTQYGGVHERWRKLQSFLQNKNSSARGNAGGGSLVTSLNELEKYVFKKTNPSLSTAKRLDLLEAKLFGKSNASLPAASRLARLQRTLGLPDASDQMAQMPNQGLPPQMKGFNNSPYFKHIQPGMPNAFGFEFGFNGDDMNDPNLNQFETQMNRMFREMERQMQEQMPPGDPSYPSQPSPLQPYHIQPSPQRHPRQFDAPIMPQPESQKKIPAYNDPNFI